MRRSVSRAISAVVVAAVSVAVGVFALRPAGSATVTTVDRTVGQAVAYAGSVVVSSGVVVLDDSTGKLYASGNYTGYFGAASVMKLFAVTKLLAIGRMASPKIAALAWSMITRSDDRALVQLIQAGRAGVSTRAAQPGGDRVDQVLHPRALLVQVHPGLRDALLEQFLAGPVERRVGCRPQPDRPRGRHPEALLVAAAAGVTEYVAR